MQTRKNIFKLIIPLVIISFIQMNQILYAQTSAVMMEGTNKPLGTARGIFPGRVVWVHDTLVSRWDGSGGFWWDDKYTSQPEVIKMLDNSLTLLTGKSNEDESWDALFRYFNAAKKNLQKGYTEGEKIAIKINENNTDAHADNNNINASPQLVYALLRSLILYAKVPQKNITVFDASRFITDNIFNKCHSEFPDVVFVDNVGGDGRMKSEYVENAIKYSADNGQLARGLAKCVVDADYIINMALLKGHVGQGVTLCGKNFYGTTNIDKDWHKNFHNNFEQDRNGKPKYIVFVDFLGHKDLGEKTMLFMIDGLYGSKSVNGIPTPKWKMGPFNNNWPGSLFLSQDGVAVDAVGLDFLSSEWPDMVDISYADAYLVEAALADNPPSKTFYDPEQDGVRCRSLGVMEHWNNSVDKKYSRNLGNQTGIELIYQSINSGLIGNNSSILNR
ncbi:MAG: DUF362 domain-containing protein [Ignavibacteriaceae bacterium]